MDSPPFAHATSRRGSAPGSPRRPSPRPPDVRRQGHAATPRPCWPSARTSPSAPSAPRSVAAAGGRRHRDRRTLGDAVGSHLRSRNVDPETVDLGRLAPRGRPLDADRRLHDRQAARVPPTSLRRTRQLRRRRRRRRPLAGRGAVDRRGRSPAEPTRDDLSDARRRRLSAVPDDELPLGDDAIELVSEDPDPRSPATAADETPPCERRSCRSRPTSTVAPDAERE